MSGPILYDFALDLRCYAVRLGASIMSVPVSIVDVDVVPGGQHLSASMLALNPSGELPFLVDGPLSLTQPAAILRHLAGKRAFPVSDPQAEDWTAFSSSLLTIFSRARNTALFKQPGDAEYDAIESLSAIALAMLIQVEDHMALQTLLGHDWLAGASPCLAEFLAFPAFAQSRDLGIEPEAFPALRLWSRRVRALPGFIDMPGIPDYH